MKKLSVLMIALIACFMIACSAVEFKVNFVVDGETIKTVSTSGTEVISIPENPTKEGYVFDGWYWDKDTWERPFTANSLLDVPLSSDMNVYCKWTLETIHVESITLNSTKLTLNIGDVETLTATTLPNNATDSSVTWSSSDSSIVSVENGKVIAHKVGTATITAITVDGGHTATCEVEVIEDMLLFKTLTVDDDKIYGTVSNSTLTFSFLKEITEMGEATYTVYKEITCESPIIGKTIPLNEGENKVYILETIGKKIALFEVTIYRLPMHEVSFDSIGGTSIPSQMIEEGSKITAPSEAPVRTGYTFAGWDFDFETAIMEPATIKAKWTPITYTITYVLNGGTNGVNPSEYTIEQSVTFANPTRTGYTFAGWYGDSSFDTEEIVSFNETTEDKTLYAKWVPITYTIAYILNGGTNGANPSEYTIEHSIVLNSPSRTGYTFEGWYSDSAFNNKETVINAGTTGSKTLYAKWTPNNNIVRFNSNGGSGTMSNLTIATDSSASLTVNRFTKTGYTFVGWSTSINGAVEYTDGATYIMGTNSSYTLYAVWEANKNTVIFNSNGGSGTMSSQAIATDSSASLTANSFTKAGYTFKGWSTSESGSVEYTDGATYTMGTNSSYALYAVWEANKNTVRFNSNGGSGTMSSLTIATDSSASLTANSFTKAGYTFVGWSTSKNGAVEYTDGAIYTMGTNSSYTLYAVWGANQNTVIFNSNGGSGTMSQISVATGSSVVLTANSFTREGYRFKGWATSEDGSVRYTDGATYTMGTNSSYALYAVWEANKNTVRFNSNGGSGTMSSLTIATDSSASLTANSFTKAGYTFVGWSTSKNGAVEYTDGAIYTMGTNSSYTLYAVWGANQNTVIFNSNGGSGTMSQISVATGSSVVLTANSFTREGYRFKGWATSEDGSVRYTDGATYTMGTNSSYTLYAVWEANKNTVRFNSNGGSGTMSNLTITTDSSASLTVNRFTKTGYTFVGWSTSENGAVEYTDGATYTMGTNSTYTLYAVWEINVYSITYELNEGINNAGNPSTFTINDLPLVLNSPTLECCEFLGWYLQNGTTKITQINSTENITISAKWRGLKFTEYNNYAEVSGYIGNVSSVVVPSTYNGKAVTSITNNAFKNCTSLVSIEIPNSVESIGESALYGCNNLTKITLPFVGTSKDATGYQSVLGSIFGYTQVGAGVAAPSNMTQQYNYYYYYIPASLKTVVITGGSINDYAFSNCSRLTSIEMSNGVTSIGKKAFYGCSSLTSIEIPNSVTSVGEFALYGCNRLKKITLPFTGASRNATGYSSVFGYIFGYTWSTSSSDSIEGATYQYGEYESKISAYKYYYYYIPTTLREVIITGNGNYNVINADAFLNCSMLTNITIPRLIEIQTCAFYGCSSLTSFVIPSSVTSIESSAFYGCTSLTIYCEATSKPSGWKSGWNYSNCSVVWGHTHAYENGECVCGIKEN